MRGSAWRRTSGTAARCPALLVASPSCLPGRLVFSPALRERGGERRIAPGGEIVPDAVHQRRAEGMGMGLGILLGAIDGEAGGAARWADGAGGVGVEARKGGVPELPGIGASLTGKLDFGDAAGRDGD